MPPSVKRGPKARRDIRRGVATSPSVDDGSPTRPAKRRKKVSISDLRLTYVNINQPGWLDSGTSDARR
jgi:hypothetical protein